jgi:hypothetical protein
VKNRIAIADQSTAPNISRTIIPLFFSSLLEALVLVKPLMRTEIGLLPEKWPVQRLGDVFENSN